MSRLQLLTTKFESLKMLKEETIIEFNVRLLDIANESFDLGEKISEEKLVCKVLRSLPKRFEMKVTTIEKAHDIVIMKVDELSGSLRTFEMSFDEKPNKKSKNIALQSNLENDASAVKIKESDENLAQLISLLAKQFGKALMRWDKREGSRGNYMSYNVQDSNSPNSRSNLKSSRLSERMSKDAEAVKNREKSFDVENVRIWPLPS